MALNMYYEGIMESMKFLEEKGKVGELKEVVRGAYEGAEGRHREKDLAAMKAWEKFAQGCGWEGRMF